MYVRMSNSSFKSYTYNSVLSSVSCEESHGGVCSTCAFDVAVLRDRKQSFEEELRKADRTCSTGFLFTLSSPLNVFSFHLFIEVINDIAFHVN